MGTGFGKLMKQAKKMKDGLAKVEEELKDRVVEASAGGGAVRASADAHGKLVSIQIDPEVVKSGDVEMLQDLILTAVNQVLDKASDLHSSEVAKLAQSLLPRIPGLGG
jgi:DNA-binding YbaB/EbfC family protein